MCVLVNLLFSVCFAAKYIHSGEIFFHNSLTDEADEFPLHQSVLICVRSNRSPFFYFPYLFTCIICMSCVCQLLNKRIYDDDDDDSPDIGKRLSSALRHNTHTRMYQYKSITFRYKNNTVLSLLHRLSTRRCPHLLVSAGCRRTSH